jgi:hypothetical protein
MEKNAHVKEIYNGLGVSPENLDMQLTCSSRHAPCGGTSSRKTRPPV